MERGQVISHVIATYFTGEGQILHTRREVLPVADYIFAVNKCKYCPSISWENEPYGTSVCSNRKLSATGSTSLRVRRFCPPPVIFFNDFYLHQIQVAGSVFTTVN